MNYDTRYPSVADLKKLAKKRIPNFAFDYVDGGIDEEHGKRKNRDAWHEIELTPRYLKDVTNADTTTRVFGHNYSLPIGVPPVGLGNMMWPGAEIALAKAAQKHNVPYILSTFSTTKLEDIAQVAPDVCWFQLYVPQKVKALVITLDIPVGAKRNRELKNGLKLPFSITPKIIWQSMIHPTWAMQTLTHGQPDFVNVLQYKDGPNFELAAFITNFAMNGVTRERIEMIRSMWDGPLVLKGVQYDQDFRDALDIGVDGVVISNHGGRQLDAAPASADSRDGCCSCACIGCRNDVLWQIFFLGNGWNGNSRSRAGDRDIPR